MVNPTSDVLIRALDGLSARAEITANNIANAGSPNFRPQQVTFEGALAAAVRAGRPVSTVMPQVQGLAGEVRIDLEAATLSATATRYSALTELLTRQIRLHSIALGGGR